MKIKKWKWIIVFCVSVFMIVICTILYLNRNVHSNQEIVIGAILPITGNSAQFGSQAREGIALAIERVNADGGVNGRRIDYIIEDGQADPRISIEAYQKLKSQDIKFILSIISSVDLAILPFAKKDNVVFISHATHPNLSNQGKNIFRHSNTVESEVDLVAGILNMVSGRITIAAVVDEYGVIFKNMLSERLKSKKNIIVNSIDIGRDAFEFKAIAAKVILLKTKVIILCGNNRNLYEIVLRLKELKYSGKIITTLGFVTSGAAAACRENIKGAWGINFDINKTQEGYEELQQEYQNKLGEKIKPGTVLFYNTILLLTTAIKEVGNDPMRVSEYLANRRQFKGKGEKMIIKNSNDITPELKAFKF